MALKSWRIPEIPPEIVRVAHAVQCSEDITSSILYQNNDVLHIATNIKVGEPPLCDQKHAGLKRFFDSKKAEKKK